MVEQRKPARKQAAVKKPKQREVTADVRRAAVLIGMPLDEFVKSDVYLHTADIVQNRGRTIPGTSGNKFIK